MSVLVTAQRTAAFIPGLRAPMAGVLGTAPKADLPKAEFWLNVGYSINVTLEDGTVESRFVGLATGIPLDTMAKLPTNQRNTQFAQFMAARNDLWEQLMSAAKQLKSGQEHILSCDPTNGLSIQLRRVNAEITEAKADDTNMFVSKLKLFA